MVTLQQLGSPRTPPVWERGASGDYSRDLGVLEAPVPREVGWRHPKG